MIVENGEWRIKGLAWDDPYRIRTWQELVNWIKEIGFLPFFGNEVDGFSVEEHTSTDFWWTGNRNEDPWEWREIIAAGGQVAYGKFFDNKAGFISLEWFPYFANARRNGYDLDTRWQEGLIGRREKKIMDFYIRENEDGDAAFGNERILSTELKKLAGFGKGGEKNFPGIITSLEMQTYLVISEFNRRKNKQGEEYGMSVSVLLPPETLWGYDLVTSAYKEEPQVSWQRIFDHVMKMYPDADERSVMKLVGRRPE